MIAALLILAASSAPTAPEIPARLRARWELQPADCAVAPQRLDRKGYLLINAHHITLFQGELVKWQVSSMKHPSPNAYVFEVKSTGRDETADMTFYGHYHIVVNANASITVWGDDEEGKQTYLQCPAANAYGTTPFAAHPLTGSPQ